MKCWRCCQDIGKNVVGVVKDCSEDDVVPNTEMGEVGG